MTAAILLIVLGCFGWWRSGDLEPSLIRGICYALAGTCLAAGLLTAFLELAT